MVEQHKARILSPDEIARLSDEMPERYRALVRLLPYCGLRVGEALGLRTAIWTSCDGASGSPAH